ncbi:hypothetical protein BD626DRAFT_582785 [Schizophyllum amplum]|uniref:Uncharacterized protein n=1 Tax=Schizophyllum amplum TaxID=97359 RepID=A0A550CJP4_9AGAR|nr:hypothetical protein BD626DRAFT_582785 [Auriculariopsis ampla]
MAVRFLSSPRRFVTWPGRFFPIVIALSLTFAWYYNYYSGDDSIFYSPHVLEELDIPAPYTGRLPAVHDDKPAYAEPANIDSPSAPLGFPSSEWCQGNECGVGKWVPRVPAVEKAVWGDPQSCRRPYDVNGEPTPEEERPAVDARRALDIINWVWSPSRGKLMELDFIDLVVRMLQSPGGLIMIGDSLTVQHRDTFSVGLPTAGIHYEVNPPHLIDLGYPKVDHVEHWVIRNTTQAWKTLVERANVPPSRLERPILTIIQYHLTVNETEIREMTEGPADAQWSHGSGRGAHPRVPGFQELVAKMATPIPEYADTVTKDTVVLMNTGAHWSRGVMGNLIPRSDTATEHALLHRTYQRMMDMHFRRLQAAPRTTIFFRSTSPAHANCHKNAYPYPTAEDAHADDATLYTRLMADAPTSSHALTWARWDWDQFKVHNGMWKTAIEQAQQERALSGEGPKWHYLDIYGLSLQRADAHANPDDDCLHWCGRPVPLEWTRQLYHQLKMIDMQDGVA